MNRSRLIERRIKPLLFLLLLPAVAPAVMDLGANPVRQGGAEEKSPLFPLLNTELHAPMSKAYIQLWTGG